MNICKNGHPNEAGGCCCPVHGNTCGYHPEWSNSIFSGKLSNQRKIDKIDKMDIKELAALSPEWKERLQKYGYMPKEK